MVIDIGVRFVNEVIVLSKTEEIIMKSLLLAATLVFSTVSFGEGVNEIIKKAHLSSYYQGKDGKAQMLMKVFSKGAKKPIKKLFYMLKMDVEEGGKQKFFTYFVKPSDIKRTTFLVHKYIDKDDYRKLYIPSSDKLLPIAGSRKQDPFMGSDFTYEDVSGRHFTKDNHKLIGEEKALGHDCYVVESVPKVKESKISKMKSWIDKKTYIPIRVEYTNHDNKIYRRYESIKIKKIDGFHTIIERVMTSLLDETKTVMLVNSKKVEYDIGLDDSVFTDRSLKNPPMKYLK